MPIGFIWQTFLETPLVNLMVLLTVVCFGSYGLALLVFTLLTRAVMFPITLRGLHSMRRMQELQPKLSEIQKKYSDPRRRSEEQMKLFKESGVNPLGCLGTQLLPLPIFIAMYQVIRITLGNTPEDVLHLSTRLYDVKLLTSAIPLSDTFLWMDLGASGNIPLTAAVFATMWLQARISAGRRMQRAADPTQAQMNQMTQWMLPVMFTWITFFFPAGLALYWAASTGIGIILQWKFVGPGDFTWGSLIPNLLRTRIGLPEHHPPSAQQPRVALAESAAGGDSTSDQPSSDMGETSESSRDQRQDGRRGTRAGTGSARPRPRAGRRRRHPRG